MNLIYIFANDGGFTVGDTQSGLTCYAYPSSPHAMAARRKPLVTAGEMIAAEKEVAFTHFLQPEYDARNWDALGGRPGVA